MVRAAFAGAARARPWSGRRARRHWRLPEPPGRGGTCPCVACGEPSCSSSGRCDCGSGLPGHRQPLAPGAIAGQTDHSHGMRRIEVKCALPAAA